MLDVRCAEHLQRVREAAERLGSAATESLEEGLDYLGNYAAREGQRYEKEGTRCEIFQDFAPLSFTFVMYHGDGKGGWVRWFNGGLIYHGPEAPGDGSYPSLTVSLSSDGRPQWSVHT